MPIFKILLVLYLALFTMCINADSTSILVVTKNQNIEQLSKKQLKQIYLEGGLHIPLKAINLKPGNKYRSAFNAKIIGLTESRLQAYWAQMRFTGRVSPPIEIAEIDELLKFLDSHPNYIAYLPPGTDVPSSLKVVFSLKY